jgi:hypothetical protein
MLPTSTTSFIMVLFFSRIPELFISIKSNSTSYEGGGEEGDIDLMDIYYSGILLKNNTTMNDVVPVGNMIPTHGIN